MVACQNALGHLMLPAPLRHVPFSDLSLLGSTILPADLDGSSGLNRAVGNRPQITANNDKDAIKAWLGRIANKKTTYDNYLKEADRLRLYAIVVLNKPVSSLSHEDLLSYQGFLDNPTPSNQWVMVHKVGRNNPEWRPFAGPLSVKSRHQALVVINSLFTWLVGAGYLSGNPLSLSKQRNKGQGPRVMRYLDHDVWHEVKSTINCMPRDSDRGRKHYWRARWLFSLLYLCGLRISEITNNSMGGFTRRVSVDGDERWWLEITGKGDKVRTIPATNELMVELQHYRRENGLPSLPLPGETTPLLFPVTGLQRSMTRAGVHSVTKRVFMDAALRVRQRGPDFEATAARLEMASTHWLRHTAGSHMANNAIDLLHVRDNLGHASLTTTNQYLHSEDDARHRSTEQRHILSW